MEVMEIGDKEKREKERRAYIGQNLSYFNDVEEVIVT